MSRYLFALIGEPDHYDNWEASSDVDQQGVFDHFRAFTDAVKLRGTLVAGEALDRPSSAFTTRRDSGLRVATDGPFAETVEQLCGFYLADLPDEATAARARSPAAAGLQRRGSALPRRGCHSAPRHGVRRGHQPGTAAR